jgi:hypothetical protein
VRDQFCRKPAGGWPVNLAPSDVGLGPYDLPEVQTGKVTAWEFSRDTRGWGALMGVSDLRAEGGELRFGTSSRDPAISVKLADVKAKAYPYVIIRMKIAPAAGDQEEMAQLFWSTTTAGVSEGASAKVALGRDDAFHDYVFKVGENKRWRGRITTFRFDPCSRSGAQVAIAGIRLSADGK